MRKIMSFLLVFLSGLILIGCKEENDINTAKIEETIRLIDAATSDDNTSVILAQSSFDGLNQYEKEQVSNYTKLYFLSNYDISYIDIQVTEPSENAVLTFFPPVSYFHHVSTKDELITKFTFDASNGSGLTTFLDGELDKIDDNMFQNHYVIAVTGPIYWEAIPNDEIFEIYLRTDNSLDIKFIKFDVTWFYEYSSYYVRVISFNTNHNLNINHVPFLYFNQTESNAYKGIS